MARLFTLHKSPEKVEEPRRAPGEIALHFQSDILAERFLDGLIDWDGNPVCYIHGPRSCNCLKIDW